MEEYIMGESDTDTVAVNAGYYTQSINSKHEEKYGKESAYNTYENSKRIFVDSINQYNHSDNHNVLLIGKVQSGKTSALESLCSIAFDNGYNLLVIYGGYDSILLNQTYKRFKHVFDVDDEKPFSSNSPSIFTTDESQVDSMDESIIQLLLSMKKPIIIIAMKRPLALSKVNTQLSECHLSELKPFIIDDEGDQASLNIKKNKKDSSATYAQIQEMKRVLHNPIYYAVTATPQANVFLNDYSDLKPGSLKLINPADGYTGAISFHSDFDHICLINDENEQIDAGGFPDSLKQAIYHFLISSALLKMREDVEDNEFSNMIIHTHRAVDTQSALYSTVLNYINGLKALIREEPSDARKKIHEFQKIYNESFFPTEIIQKYDFDSLINSIVNVISFTYIQLQNSIGKETQVNAKLFLHKIYIGGDLLQRGLTFANLLTTYFTRWTEKGNMDTSLQRGRWFGYRSKYDDLCRVFTTDEIQREFTNLATTEEDLWAQFRDIENNEMSIDDIIINSPDESKLKPTSKAKVNYKKVAYKTQWLKQKLGIFAPDINRYNNSIIESFLNDLDLQDSCKGSINDSFVTSLIAKTSGKSFNQLIRNVKEIFNYDPLLKNQIVRKMKDCEVCIELMTYEKADGKDYRIRTFETNNEIKTLQQGRSPKNKAHPRYFGDSEVLNDKNEITIQISKILPRRSKTDPGDPDNIQYFFAFHFPNARNGFVRKD